MTKIHTKKLPPKFRQNITGLYGAKGEKWLADLPQMLKKICTKWNLTLEDYFPNLSFNFVAKCSNENDEKYVLKVGVPDEDSPLLTEKNALDAFDGKGRGQSHCDMMKIYARCCLKERLTAKL